MRAIGYKSRKTLELIKERESYLEERIALLEKREELLDKEKEAILGQGGAEIKRAVLLKAMQGKWEAEKKRIDAERVKIALRTEAVPFRLNKRIDELLIAMSNIKKKPSTMSNHDILIKNQGAYEEINHMLKLIDEYRD